NWTSIEEEHLAVSYITVGKEPKCANNQSGLKFWKKIGPATLKFSSCYAKISCNPGSGTSPIDWLHQAKALYSSEKNGQEFKHNLAWEKLQYHEKWLVPSSS
ncbi:hypothetical protein CROQUDRAFT_46420, partial [Cronartium quercuum f. sp. fusiforme G11]